MDPPQTAQKVAAGPHEHCRFWPALPALALCDLVVLWKVPGVDHLGNPHSLQLLDQVQIDGGGICTASPQFQAVNLLEEGLGGPRSQEVVDGSPRIEGQGRWARGAGGRVWWGTRYG